MTQKVLGPVGSTRRRRFLFWPILMAACTALFFVAGAQAVHDAGFFQLDGNAQTSDPGTPASTGADDWDKVCHQVNPAACPSPITNTTNATATAWVAEPNQSSSIFTGGGSKDPIDISSWAWKDGSGGLPDKDNLQHGFAARYSKPSSANCPGPGGNTNGTTTCDVLYFGSDRFDNSGDAQQGFWFFQNKITLGTTPNGGGTSFNGVHKLGDLLIISDFSNGGTTSFISVYRWNPAFSGNLELLSQSGNARCDLQGPADAFCGIVNSATKPMPWSFLDKSGTPNNGALNGEFYEGGINLSSFGLGGECFSSIASETRSSTSTTATLKDFVLGQFAVCGATTSTTPSAGAGGEVSPGTSVTDLATVQGTGTASPPTPSGNVTFFMCSFAAGSTDTCDASDAAHTGTQVGSAVALADSSPPAGEAQATSDAVNTVANPLLPGRYCFRSSWPGDTNYTDGPYVHSGTGNSECFIVRQIPTDTTTSPSNSSGNPLTSPLALGTTLFDKAVVTGTAAGGTPTGTIAFFLCDPTQVQGLAGAETCTTGGTALSGNPRTLVADAGSSPPSSSVLSSPGVVANKAGVWCFRAVYTPTGSTYLTSSDARHSECVTVNPDATTTVTSPQAPAGTNITGPVAVGTSVFDKAVVTGTTAGGTPTGTVDFFICNPSQVQGLAGAETCATGGTALTGNPRTIVADAGSSPPSASATSSPAVNANVVGVWCFRAVYTSSGTNAANYTGSSDARHSECFTVNDSTSATSAQDWLPNDSATVTSAGGTALNGTLSFTLYPGGSCAGTALIPAESFTLTGAASPTTRSTTNASFKVSASTTVSWKVVFASSDANVTGFTKCTEQTSLTITN